MPYSGLPIALERLQVTIRVQHVRPVGMGDPAQHALRLGARDAWWNKQKANDEGWAGGRIIRK